MAAATTGVSRRTGAGGALFLVSDLLIGLGAAGVHLPAQGLLVMSTYIAALLLITTGWVAASATTEPVPGPAVVTTLPATSPPA